MAYGNLLADVVQGSTAGTPPQFNDGSGTQVGTLCRAWVNFNGSTAAIRASFNVGSITKVSTGLYTVNFTNAMPDANYSVNSTCTGNFSDSATTSANTYAAGSVRVQSAAGTNSTLYDTTYMSVSVFR